MSRLIGSEAHSDSAVEHQQERYILSLRRHSCKKCEFIDTDVMGVEWRHQREGDSTPINDREEEDVPQGIYTAFARAVEHDYDWRLRGRMCCLIDDHFEGCRRAAKVHKFREKHLFYSFLLRLFLVDEGVVMSRPFLRGKVHLIQGVASPLIAWLVISPACDAVSYVSTVLAVLVMMFNAFASSMLHHTTHPCPARIKLLRRFDHGAIFSMISLSTLPTMTAFVGIDWLRWLIVTTSFIAAVVGIYLPIFTPLLRAVASQRAVIYISYAGVNLYPLYWFFKGATVTQSVFYGLEAFSYILGALCYAIKKPSNNDWFGHHECFHFFCGTSLLINIWLNHSTTEQMCIK